GGEGPVLRVASCELRVPAQGVRQAMVPTRCWGEEAPAGRRRAVLPPKGEGAVLSDCAEKPAYYFRRGATFSTFSKITGSPELRQWHRIGSAARTEQRDNGGPVPNPPARGRAGARIAWCSRASVSGVLGS